MAPMPKQFFTNIKMINIMQTKMPLQSIGMTERFLTYKRYPKTSLTFNTLRMGDADLHF